MKKMNLIYVLLLMFVTSLFAQTPNVEWAYTFGTSDHDECWDLQQTSDGGFIMAGSSYTDDDAMYDVYLVKTDNNGIEEWTKVFGYGMFDLGYSVKQTPDGGFIVAGTSDSQFLAIKIDSSGNEQWHNFYGGDGDETAFAVDLTDDGCFVLAGSTNSYGAGFDDMYLIKINADGDTLWTKTYGENQGEAAYSVHQTSDGGYILAGANHDYLDAYIVKTDAQGDTLWTKTFGGVGGENAFAIEQTSDNGYIFVGKTQSYGAGAYDVYLVKLDENGNEQWTKTFGEALDDIGWDVRQCTDGGYYITGETFNFQEYEDWSDIYMIKTDSEGNAVWTKTYSGDNYHTNDWGKSGLQTANGNYVSAGALYTEGSMNDFVLLKITTNGVSNNDVSESNGNLTIDSIYPNPFKISGLSRGIGTTISYFVNNERDNVTLTIYNLKGQKIKTLVNQNLSKGKHIVNWNGLNENNQQVSSGIYFCNVKSGNYSSTKKMMLIK